MSERLYQPKLPSLASAIRIVSDLPAFLAQDLEREGAGVERLSVDRYLSILDALEHRALYDCSLLDIGCSSGFFSYLFAVTACRQVTAVEIRAARPPDTAASVPSPAPRGAGRIRAPPHRNCGCPDRAVSGGQAGAKLGYRSVPERSAPLIYGYGDHPEGTDDAEGTPLALQVDR